MQGLHPGNRLEGYRIDAVEREGDGAAVLRAYEESEDRPVALHVAQEPHGALATTRFLERVRRLGGVDHPHLLEVYGARTLSGRAVAVTEAPPGTRLDELLADGPIGAHAAVRLARQVASAVEALEAAGAEPPPLAAERIWVDASGDAHLDALDARGGVALPQRAASSSAALAQLLEEMTEHVPPALRAVVTRASDGAFLSTGQLADELGRVQAGTNRRRRRLALAVAIAATLTTAGIVLESIL